MKSDKILFHNMKNRILTVPPYSLIFIFIFMLSLSVRMSVSLPLNILWDTLNFNALMHFPQLKCFISSIIIITFLPFSFSQINIQSNILISNQGSGNYWQKYIDLKLIKCTMAFMADDIWQGDESIYMQEMIILQ